MQTSMPESIHAKHQLNYQRINLTALSLETAMTLAIDIWASRMSLVGKRIGNLDVTFTLAAPDRACPVLRFEVTDRAVLDQVQDARTQAPFSSPSLPLVVFMAELAGVEAEEVAQLVEATTATVHVAIDCIAIPNDPTGGWKPNPGREPEENVPLLVVQMRKVAEERA
jgi:hypothetical protein